MSLKVNSIRWGATGECATVTRNLELKPMLPAGRQLEGDCGNSQRLDAEEKTEDRQKSSVACITWLETEWQEATTK